jgi:hypothetical protein
MLEAAGSTKDYGTRRASAHSLLSAGMRLIMLAAAGARLARSVSAAAPREREAAA